MKRSLRPSVATLLISSFLAATSVLAATGPTRATTPAFDTAPAAAGLTRLLHDKARQITLVPVARTGVDDSFTLSGTSGAIRIEGTSPATLLAGAGWYLKHVAKVDVGWPGDSLGRLPATLPAVPGTITNTAVVPHRYALNDTDDGYSGAYRTFQSYQRDIDLLALHGVNEVFVQMGAEYPYYKALQNFGYSAQDLREWIPQPAHQGWWLLQNMSNTTNNPVSDSLINARAAQGRQIADYLRSLRMTPVLPGYYGNVPTDFRAKNPTAHVVEQGIWQGYQRPHWLDPTSPVFAEVAAAYYSAQREKFGDSTMYKMDPLHEAGGKSTDMDLPAVGAAIQKALNTAHPEATWAILGWSDNPDLIKNLDKSRTLVLDGVSDRYDDLDRETKWGGIPYAFGAIDNFGGHTTIGAATSTWVERFEAWRTKPHSALKGIAYLPEGTGGNPASFDLFTELAWRPTGIDQRAWFADYASRRYGGTDPHATAAWDLLRRGPYSLGTGSSAEPQDSLFTARPDLGVNRSASWSPTAVRYDASTVQRALAELLQVDSALRTSDAYTYDLVDTARQALTNRSRVLLPQLNAAYSAGNLTAFRALVEEWADDMALLERLTASDSRFLLGPWLEQAKAWGATAAEKAQLEYDARSLLTTWGNTAEQSNDGALHDYGNRELAGLIGDFYAPRWAAYFKVLDTALATNSAPLTPTEAEVFAGDDRWARKSDTYATVPVGDSYALAKQISDTLPAIDPAGPITNTPSRCVDIPNADATNGKALQLYSCNSTEAQQWTPGTGTDRTIRAKGRCMDVRWGATTAGTVVQIHECNGTPAQDWISAPDGTLKNTKSGLCLATVAGRTEVGTGLEIAVCDATSAAQRWTVPS
ncbi:alpha-N-acetylglucosaminidase TIM-barrel domain-containing protein [Kitasatospora sp. NPDC059327]|uniref:alpha-N-acetylglucosaminidase TIM-barrel domain-containing protein n=1 Tax=Kitasatospora sp. NPDC059327 TaxID=3346803 RepID=UPI0036D09ACA